MNTLQERYIIKDYDPYVRDEILGRKRIFRGVDIDNHEFYISVQTYQNRQLAKMLKQDINGYYLCVNAQYTDNAGMTYCYTKKRDISILGWGLRVIPDDGYTSYKITKLIEPTGENIRNILEQFTGLSACQNLGNFTEWGVRQ